MDGMVSGFSLGSWADVLDQISKLAAITASLWSKTTKLGEIFPGASRISSWVVPNYSYLKLISPKRNDQIQHSDKSSAGLP